MIHSSNNQDRIRIKLLQRKIYCKKSLFIISKKTILFQTIIILILKKDIVSSYYIHKAYILSIIAPFQSKSHPTEKKAFIIFAAKYLITNKKEDA